MTPSTPAWIDENPVVAVLRATHARECRPVVAALIEGGVRAIELTLTTEGVAETLPGLVDEFDGGGEIGVGTVVTAGETEAVVDAGARFVVTPTTETEVVEAAVARGVPVFPGGLTPTELHRGWRAGATAVKLFPAATVGTGYLAQLRGPFPQIPVIPSGGVGVEDAPEWIRAGAAAVSLGGPLLQDVFTDGDMAALTQRARRVSGLVAEARS